MAKHHVTATVNGDPVEMLCETEDTLLDALRDGLGLTGTKEGCSTGDCGACSVTVDGRLVCSCLMLAVEAEGRSVDLVIRFDAGVPAGSRTAQLPGVIRNHAASKFGFVRVGVEFVGLNGDERELLEALVARQPV